MKNLVIVFVMLIPAFTLSSQNDGKIRFVGRNCYRYDLCYLHHERDYYPTFDTECYGDVYIVPDEEPFANFYVYVEKPGKNGEFKIFLTSDKPQKCGEWRIVKSPEKAKFTIKFVKDREHCDFSISYVKERSKAGVF